MQDRLVVASKNPNQAAIAIYNDKSIRIGVINLFVKDFRVEMSVTVVVRALERFDWFQHADLLFGASFVDFNDTTENN